MKITTLLLSLATASLFWNPAAQAAEIVVQNTNDSDTGSLRQAIADAQPGDTITFDSSLAGQTIVLTSGELLINNHLTINGPGARVLSVMRSQADGTPDFRIFHITWGVTAKISGLTIANGRAAASEGFFPWGGGIYSQEAWLTLDAIAVTGNFAVNGGGIANERGTMNVSNSTISANTSSFWGGGLYSWGDIGGGDGDGDTDAHQLHR